MKLFALACPPFDEELFFSGMPNCGAQNPLLSCLFEERGENDPWKVE